VCNYAALTRREQGLNPLGYTNKINDLVIISEPVSNGWPIKKSLMGGRW